MPTPTLTTLINFTGSGTGNGADPLAGLALDANGDLFGTTSSGGANNDGTVFELKNTAGGYAAARDRGTLRLEGRDYVMQDGDVISVKFTR